MPTLKERIEGGLIGLLVGDAVGVPYEFHAPEQLPPLADIEMIPPAGFQRVHDDVPPGTWSDDGAQALALLASLLSCGRFDAEDFGRRLVAWCDEGYMAVGGYVFDIGIQTSRAINRLQKGVPALQAGGADEQGNGNGSLMRVLPLALWHRSADAELVADAQTQSLVTHGHLRAQVCCALYCLWARRVLEAVDDPWSAAVATLRAIYQSNAAALTELETKVCPDAPAQGTGLGYVVDCLHSARWALEAPDFEQVIKRAIACGHDTDTTACVAGGIAGIRDGSNGIPERWRNNLRGNELYQPLLQDLLRHCAVD
jgi:ADP-ribosyl-[dinitrogen reductase] hydrolase